MKKITLILTYFLLFVPFILGLSLPYHVDQEILAELAKNQQLYEQHPTENEAIFNLAMSYAYTGQVVKGWKKLKLISDEYANTVVTKYAQLSKEHSSEWRYPFKYAFGFFFKKEKEKAIDQFKRVIEIKPTEVWAYAYIALIYGEMGNSKKCLEYCKKALKIEKNATAVYVLQAEAYRREKKYFKALKSTLTYGRLYSKHE